MEDGGNNIGSKDAFRSFKPGPECKVILLGFFQRESINCLASQNNEFKVHRSKGRVLSMFSPPKIS